MKRDTIVLGRFQVEEKLPAQGELLRWSAVDHTTGMAVEIHQPAPPVWVRPSAEETFIAAKDGVVSTGALQAPLAWGEHAGRPLAIYPSSRRWPRSPLTATQVTAVAEWLIPAVCASGEALSGRLTPDDLALEKDGSVVLRPDGVARKRSLAVPDPYLAPGSGSPAQRALYGLGVVLFEAATGTEPFSARTIQDLERQQQSPRRPSSVNTDLPLQLDALILGLLSPHPADRTAAIRGLPEGGPVALQLPAAPDAAPSAEARSQSRSPSPPSKTGARRDLPKADWQVVAQPSSLPISIRRRLAALADIPEAAMSQAAEEGVLLPVGGAETQAAAQGIMTRLAVSGAELSVQRLHASTLAPKLTIAALMLPVALAALGLLAAGLIGVSMVWPAIVVVASLALAVVGSFVALGVMFRRRKSGPLRRGHLLVQGSYPALDPLREQLRETRRALLTSELSTPARVDLLTAADDIEAILSGADAEERQRLLETLVDIQDAASSPQDRSAEKTIALAQRQAQAAKNAAELLKG